MPNWPISAAPPCSRLRRRAVEKGAGAGTRDGAERLDEIVAAHADAVVGDSQRLGFGIDGDGDARTGRRRRPERARRSTRSAAFRRRRRRWRSARARNVAVRIDRMHHQVQQPRNSASKFWVLAAASAGAALSAFEWASVVNLGPHGISIEIGNPDAQGAGRLISRRTSRFSEVSARGGAEKKADRLGGGPPIRRPAWQYVNSKSLGGWGANSPNATDRTIAGLSQQVCYWGCGVGLYRPQPGQSMAEHKVL